MPLIYSTSDCKTVEVQVCKSATLEEAPSSASEADARNVGAIVEEIAAMTSPLQIMDRVSTISAGRMLVALL